MASDLLIATRSADKLEEIRAILQTSVRARLLALRDLGIAHDPAEEDIEQHATFIENAVAKAHYFAQRSGLRVLADDSGLVVNALQGGPGVRTRRFAIDNGYVAADVAGKALDEANNDLLLERLANVADEQRHAHYVCAVAFANPDRVIASSVGTCSGVIARERKGSGGFGYDPLFFLPPLSVTFAQLTPAEKNARSHRAIAFRAIAAQLR